MTSNTFAIAAVETPSQQQHISWLEAVEMQFPDVDVFDQLELLARQRDVFVNAGLDDGALWDASHTSRTAPDGACCGSA